MIHEWRMRGRLQSYTDGELSATPRAAVADHLAECAECAGAVRRLAQTDRLLASGRPSPPPLPPAVAHALLRQALAEAGRLPGGPSRGWPLLAWGLSAGLVVAATGAAAWWGIRPTRDSGMTIAPTDQPSMIVTARTFSGEETEEHSPIRNTARRGPAPRKRPPDERPGEPRSPQEKPPIPRAEPAVPPAPAAPPGSGSGERPRRARPPRYRVAQAPGLSLCGTLSAAWWGRLTEEVAANEASAIALHEEIRLSAEREDPAREQPVDDAVAGITSPEASTEETESGLRLAQGPEEALPGGPFEGVDPAAGDNEEVARVPAPAVSPSDVTVADAPPAPQLFVMVNGAPELPGVTTTCCPEGEPGYARSIALRPDGRGGVTWTQATVTSEEDGPKLALVMLGTESPWW